MAEQGSSARYTSVTPEGTPPSSPRESHTDAAQAANRDEQVDAARRNEIAVLSLLRHENITGYTKELDGSIRLEKLDTSLDLRLKDPLQMTLFQKMVVMKHMAQAMAYLHGLERPILHLNFQPSSIQLGSKAGVLAKLSQFGVSRFADEIGSVTPSPSMAEPLTSSPTTPSSLSTTSTPESTSTLSQYTSEISSVSSASSSTAGGGLAPSSRPSAPMGFGAIPSRSKSPSPTPFGVSSGASNASTGSSVSPSSSASHVPTRPPSAAILSKMLGAPIYNPPEAFKGEPYTCASDVYSFGLTMTELMIGSSPFSSVRSLAGLVSAMSLPPEFPDDLPSPVASLLARCRDVDPCKRPGFHEILVNINEMFVPVFVHDNVAWARKFWYDSFFDSISVRWSEFVGALIRTLGLPTTPNEITFRGVQMSKEDECGLATRKLHCLKQLLFPGLTDDTDFMRAINLWVDIDKFGHIIGTFSDESTRLETFLESVATLIETGWFHGDATGSSGPHRLGSDTFLVRLSAPAQNSLKPPNCWFTFSLKTSAGNFVRETRIQRLPGRSECLMANSAREVFPSLYALAESKGKSYGTAPCPSFLYSTLHPVAAEYKDDDGESSE